MAEKDDYLIDILLDLGFVAPDQVDKLRGEAHSAGVGVVDLMVAIEEEFGVEIDQTEMASLATVGDAVELLEDKLA